MKPSAVIIGCKNLHRPLHGTVFRALCFQFKPNKISCVFQASNRNSSLSSPWISGQTANQISAAACYSGAEPELGVRKAHHIRTAGTVLTFSAQTLISAANQRAGAQSCRANLRWELSWLGGSRARAPDRRGGSPWVRAVMSCLSASICQKTNPPGSPKHSILNLLSCCWCSIQTAAQDTCRTLLILFLLLVSVVALRNQGVRMI